MFTASGSELIRLVDSSMIVVGHPIRIVWSGYKDIGADPDTGNERKMKQFEFYVAEENSIDLVEEEQKGDH